MHTLGEYVGVQRSLDGDLIASFAIDEEADTLEKLETLKGKELAIDIKKYNPKRSLNANAYFWKLCDQIAKKLGSDKDTVYHLLLRDHGVFDMVEVVKPAIDYLRPLYRVVEIDHYYSKPLVDEAGNEYVSTMAVLKCYKGSSQYDSKQMADLINGTVQQAKDLGIETWTQEEVNNLIANWKGQDSTYVLEKK